jgi:hypothetical protein
VLLMKHVVVGNRKCVIIGLMNSLNSFRPYLTAPTRSTCLIVQL